LLGLRDEGEDKPKNRAGAFVLHALQTTGDPMVHTLTRTRPEVVLFGANQEFRPPMYLSAGRHIIITSQPGDNKISMAKFQVGQPDQRREVSLQVADVIRAADELGASYPDIVQMLADASKQKNLPTRLAIDELPEGGRVYYRPNSSGGKKPKVRVGKDNMTPNLFPEQEEPPAPGAERKREEPRGNMANVTEESSHKPKDKDKNPDDQSSKETSSKSSKPTSRSSRDDSKKESEKKGMFSWLSWTKDEK
ncbi:MAG TPA: hypothetical protein VGM98_05900, partial [Schlesneria sp.]